MRRTINRPKFTEETLKERGITIYRAPNVRDCRFGDDMIFLVKNMTVVGTNGGAFGKIDRLNFNDALHHSWYPYPKEILNDPSKMADYLLDTVFKDCD